MSGDFVNDTEPDGCGGRGYFSGPACCGNTINGECRAHCCVQEQVRCDGCEDCTPTPEGSPDDTE